MVMEYASGGNLEQILSDQSVKFESLHDLYTRAFYICSALRHIHDIGLTHNDLHPGNVLAKHRNATMMFKPDTQLGILNPLIAKFRKRFRNQLMPGTRMYVMQRMAAYEANLAAGNLSSGFEFFDQPGSFRSKLTSPSRSQYYTREQLINYTRQLTISEGPDRPTNVCGRHNLTDFVDLFHHQY
ncbi:hypothetical protein BC936DRAFT_144705 [Jimgerdemannia flammicorona]|uniref:Protein kinase domain-containing protein n=1 Tax=Jimgerdemannia flammicorona TaxID=994334 RepID=A0A433DBX7_9FUNG|nr:hypothetical protein BC936DRAFT_144705 [Jimgerdemannia flammicorona]